jgi:hypothetical protein
LKIFRSRGVRRSKHVEIKQQIAFGFCGPLRSIVREFTCPAMESMMEFGAHHFALVLATDLLPKTIIRQPASRKPARRAVWCRVGDAGGIANARLCHRGSAACDRYCPCARPWHNSVNRVAGWDSSAATGSLRMPIANLCRHQTRGKFVPRRQPSDDDRQPSPVTDAIAASPSGARTAVSSGRGGQVDRPQLHRRPLARTGSISCPAGDHSGASS